MFNRATNASNAGAMDVAKQGYSNPYLPLILSAGFGGVGGGLAGLFNKPENAMDAASPYLEQAKGSLEKYFKPYTEAGTSSLPQLQELFSQMRDPNTLLQNIGKGYQQSPGYQFARNQGLQSILNAQASGGMLGTPQHQQMAGELSTNLANQDYSNYLKEALGIYGGGVSGLQDIFKTGAQAGMGYGQDLASLLGTQSGLAYQNAQEKNQSNADMWGNLFKGAGNLLPLLFL